MSKIFGKRFTVIAVYRENTERFNQTVSECLVQMKSTDELIIVCTDTNDTVKELRRNWRRKPNVSVRYADTVQDGYNEILAELNSEYVVFVHEGDSPAEGFFDTAYGVMTGEIEQKLPAYMETSSEENTDGNDDKNDDENDDEEDDESADEKKYISGKVYACIEDPEKTAVLIADNWWRNNLISAKDERFVLSRITVKGIFTIGLAENPWAFQTALNGAVVRTEVLKRYHFDNKIRFEYETDVLLRILMDEKKYLVCNQMKYYYFEPKEKQILYHIPAHYKEWYFDSIEQYLLPLMERENEKSNSPFIQNYAVYYVLCRFLSNQDNKNKAQIPEEEFDNYLVLLKKVFDKVDDYYLLNQEKLPYLSKNPEILCMFLRIKYGIGNVDYDYRIEEDPQTGEKDLVMYYRGHVISAMSRHRFGINIMNYTDGKVQIDGSLISIFQYGNVEYYAEFNGKEMPVIDTDAYSLTKFFGIPAYRRITYHLELPLDPAKKSQWLRFYAKYRNETIPMKISFNNHWAKLNKSPRYSYWRFNKYLCHHAENAIVFKRATLFNVLKRETQLQLNMLRINTKASKKALRMRWLYWLTRPYFSKKKIWLMLDKLYKGGDSCEYLYRYSAKKNDGITKYYLINKDTSDYKKLKKDGYKPLVNGSLLHKLVFVNADLVLITNSHLFPFNGYTKDKSKYIRGLCNFTSMCLQHGLTVQKCAIAQRRIIDNTTGYFLASKYEYENLSRHAYGYKGFDALKLTGIARYDGLINNDKKQILLSPTWRMYNALPVTTSEGEQRAYNPEFKHTEYFKVYNNLINHKRLIDCARETGYKIKFLLHPILSSQAEDFTPNPELEVIPSVGNLSYEKILTESSLMVTDYSGVQFDFAYMRKPIVYFHPEELPAHYEEGVFFYDTMGFGEICTKTEELVDVLCEYMRSGCQMKEKYIARADDFFAYSDHNNCERIYQEILKSQKQIDRDKLRDVK